MEVKNGIIIDGVLHEAIKSDTDKIFTCYECSLKELCYSIADNLCNTLNKSDGFISRGKVKLEKEETE